MRCCSKFRNGTDCLLARSSPSLPHRTALLPTAKSPSPALPYVADTGESPYENSGRSFSLGGSVCVVFLVCCVEQQHSRVRRTRRAVPSRSSHSRRCAAPKRQRVTAQLPGLSPGEC